MSRERVTIILVILFHSIGAVGFLLPALQPLFMQLVPYHLLLMLGLLGLTAYDGSPGLLIFGAIIFLLGFLVEVLGVNTGLIFGQYTYGKTLGFKLWNTPLLIGVNWLILVYSIGVSLNKLRLGPFLFAVLGAFLMVMIDCLIEPVAIRFDYWTWHDENIPLQNYLGWFLVSFLFFLVFNAFNFRKQNSLAFVMVVSQFAFFLVLNAFAT